MKLAAITGHTSGIGKALAAALAVRGWEIQGFSRAGGYDIATSEGRERIVREASNASLFINNAYSGGAQTELLYSFFEVWKSEAKTIVCIGSDSSDGIKNYAHPYAVHKAGLDKAAEQLAKVSDASCRVFNIKPGWVNTPRAKVRPANEPALAPEDVAAAVIWAIEQPARVYVSRMSLTAR